MPRARVPNFSRQLALLGALAGAALASGCGAWRLDRAAQVATGFTSHLLCDDVLVTGVPAEQAFAERVRPQPGMGLVAWAMQREVDTARGEVRVSLAGAFESRARLRPGLGCLVLPADIADDATPLDAAGLADDLPRLRQPLPPPDAPGEAVVDAARPQLQLALSRALVDVPGQSAHRTKAVVVMHQGRLVAERYAPGYGVHTPVLGFSLTKSVSNALLAILVRQGKLALDQPVPLPEWQDPADPRHAITVAQLLRQTPGLDLPQNNSGFDISSQIMYTVRDKAAAAARAPLAVAPGSRWAYSDTNFMLLSRVMRDAAGGRNALLRLARDELFAPLGMRDVVLDVDATGTPVGASHLLASARDWARFGQLYLDDGVAGGRRILPAGWVAMSATPTLDTGYGAGFWTNRLPGNVPAWGVPWGLSQAPADTFFARGFMGQFVVVVPSRQLVVVRLSVSSQRGDDIEATNQLVGDILAALPPGPAGPGASSAAAAPAGPVATAGH